MSYCICTCPLEGKSKVTLFVLSNIWKVGSNVNMLHKLQKCGSTTFVSLERESWAMKQRIDWDEEFLFQTTAGPLLLLMPSLFSSMLCLSILCFDFLLLHYRMNGQLNNNLDISFSVLCRVANAFWNNSQELWCPNTSIEDGQSSLIKKKH